MQYSQEHLKTMVYAKFGGQTECIMGNSKIVNGGTKKLVHKNKAIFLFLSKKSCHSTAMDYLITMSLS